VSTKALISSVVLLLPALLMSPNSAHGQQVCFPYDGIPGTIGSTGVPCDEPFDVIVSGDFAYTLSCNQVSLFDVSNAAAMTELATEIVAGDNNLLIRADLSSGDLFALEVHGQELAREYSVVHISGNAPGYPQYLGRAQVSAGSSFFHKSLLPDYSVAVSDDYVAIGHYSSTLLVRDAYLPVSSWAQYDYSEYSIRGWIGSDVAVTVQNREVLLVDFSDPSSPVERGAVSVEDCGSTNNFNFVRVNGSRIAVCTTGSYALIDASDPDQPYVVGSPFVPGGWVFGYEGDFDGARLVVNQSLAGEIDVYRADTQSGLVFDGKLLVPPEFPVTVGRVSGDRVLALTESTASSLIALNIDYAHGGGDAYRLYEGPVPSGAGQHRGIVAVGDECYWIHDSTSISAADISDPSSPVPIGTYSLAEPGLDYLTSIAVAPNGNLLVGGRVDKMLEVEVDSGQILGVVRSVDIENDAANGFVRHIRVFGGEVLAVTGGIQPWMSLYRFSDLTRTHNQKFDYGVLQNETIEDVVKHREYFVVAVRAVVDRDTIPLVATMTAAEHDENIIGWDLRAPEGPI